MTIAELTKELGIATGSPVKIQFSWSGNGDWSAEIPGQMLIDPKLKTTSSTLVQGPTPKTVVERFADHLKGKNLMIGDKPFPIPPDLEVGPVDF